MVLHVMSTANSIIPSDDYPIGGSSIILFMPHDTQKHILSTDEQAATFSMIYFVFLIQLYGNFKETLTFLGVANGVF